MAKVSVVIVNYNSTKLLNKLIQSSKKIGNIIQEVIIVDNNSQDLYLIKNLTSDNKKTKIIKNEKNFGFAKAVNQGTKIAKSKYILLLNPDTKIIDKSIENTLTKIINDPKIAAIGGRIKKANANSYQFTANSNISFVTALFEFTILKKLFPTNKHSKEFWIENKITKKTTNVFGLCGAYIIFRKHINGELNTFDENYFLYLEDLDFCIKLRKLGYKVMFDPTSKIEHIGGASSNSKYNIKLKYWYKSRKYLFIKHLGPIKGIILAIIFSIEEILLKTYHILKNEPSD